MSAYVFQRLLQPAKFRKLCVERLTEPLHLNLISLAVALAGSYRTKIDFDLVVRQQYAFSILYAADCARRFGLKAVTLIEFGVANGAGLINMCRIAERTRRATGIEFRIFGFDGGVGLPAALDYRDLPEDYQQGDYPMDVEKLKAALPGEAKLIVGDIGRTVPAFLKSLDPNAPIGSISVDVDYYSSASKALQVLAGVDPRLYLPFVPVYLDDITCDGSNAWTGELLAVNEFNAENAMRKIAPFTLLRSRRIFKNTQWIDRMYLAHIHDHPMRSPGPRRNEQNVALNEYLN